MERLKSHFIPHDKNHYHAPALHRKRHVGYGLFAIGMKGVVLLIAILLPLEVFVTPDALRAQLVDIVAETNKLRTSVGEAALEVHPQLDASAALKAADMRDNHYFAHTSPQGVGVADVIRRGGYEFRYGGENLAVGFSSAKDVVTAWEASPTHYRNLVHPIFFDIGVGVAVGEQNGVPVPYFVQHFGTPTGADLSVLGSFTDDTEVLVLPQSRIFWKEVPGGIQIEPQVFLNREVSSVTLTEFDTDVILTREDAMYTANYTLLTTVSDLFQPTLPVSILIETENGEVIESIVPWYNPPVFSPSMIDRYHMAVAYVDDIVPLVIVSRMVLIFSIVLFAFSILAHMAWSIHTHKHRITFESLLVLTSLVVLLVI